MSSKPSLKHYYFTVVVIENGQYFKVLVPIADFFERFSEICQMPPKIVYPTNLDQKWIHKHSLRPILAKFKLGHMLYSQV